MSVAIANQGLPQPLRVLVAEDEETLRTVIGHVLRADGHDVVTVASGEEALMTFNAAPFPLVITDIVMGGLNGLELLQKLKRIDPSVHVVIMTSNASLDSVMVALRAGAYDYLTKPFEDLEIISAVVNRAVQNIRLIEENARLVAQLKVWTEELERLNHTLHDRANRDGLTGLFNHRHFRDALASEFARSTRYGHQFSLVLVDIDRFKNFNDTYGHLAGDDALKGMSAVLQSVARKETILARYGGEEFVFLLPETDKIGARAFAERARKTAAETPGPQLETGLAPPLTLSLGVSTFPEDGREADVLVNHADRALYQAKNGGRNRVCG